MENQTICRVCLGDADIPIYGEEDESRIAEDIRIYGDIQLIKDDGYPNHICVTCYKLLQNAVVFRNTAQETELFLIDTISREERTIDSSNNPVMSINTVDNTKREADIRRTPHQTEQSEMESICTDENEMVMIIVSDEQKEPLEPEQEIKHSKVPNQKRFQLQQNGKGKKNENDTHKNDSELYQLICDKCGKIFKKKHNLDLHLLTHGAEYAHKCMFCPYRGKHASLLKIHVRTHTGDYNYNCTKCPAKFITKSNLNKHLQRHIGPVDFKCNLCEKCFYSKPDLNKHYDAIHLGLKKYVCNICGKAFSFRNNMMCHQLKVHKRKRLTEGKGRVADYLKDELDGALDSGPS